MSYGGGFLGGLGAFAGGLSKGWDEQRDQKRADAADKRAQEEHDLVMKRAAEEDDLKKKLGMVTPGTVIGGSKLASGFYDSDAAAQAAVEAARQQNVPANIADVSAQAQAVPVNVPQVAPALPGTRPQAALPQAPQAAAPAAPAPKAPTVKDQYLAGGNDLGIDLSKPVIFRDPQTGKYRITDEGSARKATDTDVFAHAAAVYMGAGQVDKALDIRDKAGQVIDREADRAQKAAGRALDAAIVNPSQANFDKINDVLTKWSDDNSITHGGRFGVVKTQDGKYTIGAAPDGSGMPLQPAPTFGVYDTPQQMYIALKSLVTGDTAAFAGLQKEIFDQSVSLRQLAIQQGHLDLARQSEANSNARGWAALRQGAAQIAESRAARLDAKQQAQVIAAQNTMDRTIGAQLAQLGVEPGTPEYEQKYGLLTSNYLKRNPTAAKLLGAADTDVDFTGVQVPTRLADPRKQKTAIPAPKVSSAGSPYGAGNVRIPLPNFNTPSGLTNFRAQ